MERLFKRWGLSGADPSAMPPRRGSWTADSFAWAARQLINFVPMRDSWGKQADKQLQAALQQSSR
jgi:hypothetical protein